MNCMKCGKETADGQVFCDSCLEVMKQYPVKPDTVVQLPPKRILSNEKKSTRKKDLSPKELLRKQWKLLKLYRYLTFGLAILLTLALAALIFVGYTQTTFFDFIPFLP